MHFLAFLSFGLIVGAAAGVIAFFGGHSILLSIGLGYLAAFIATAASIGLAFLIDLTSSRSGAGLGGDSDDDSDTAAKGVRGAQMLSRESSR